MSEQAKRLFSLDQILEHTHDVGAVVSINYEKVTVASSDWLVDKAGGIPRRCFLLAVPEGGEPDNVILLSVTDTATLETMRGVQELKEEIANRRGDEETDPGTSTLLSLIGYTCSIVGSFYTSSSGVRFGADIDQVLSSTSYRVLKPVGKSLGLIASYSRNSTDESATLGVGTVRYTETQRKPDHEAVVNIDIRDFIGKKTALLGMSRSGKALAEDTLLPVPVSSKFPSGWARNDELAVGDLIYTSEMREAPITSVTEWCEEEVFALGTSDGQYVNVSGNHLWRVTNRDMQSTPSKETQGKRERKQKLVGDLENVLSLFQDGDYITLKELSELTGYTEGRLHTIAKEQGVDAHLSDSAWISEGSVRREIKIYPARELLYCVIAKASDRGNGDSRATSKLMTTKELKEEGLRRTWGDQKGSKFSIQLQEPVEGVIAELPIDPYVLGRWLGDGRRSQGYLGADSKPRPWDGNNLSDYHYLWKELEAAGCSTHKTPSGAVGINVQDLIRDLKALNLTRNKHIPAIYLRASYKQRLALLQGLMDSYGSASKDGGLGLDFSNETLATQATELIRSLGMKAKITSKQSGYLLPDGGGKDCGLTYLVSFNTTVPVFRLPRKLSKQSNNQGFAPAGHLYIDSIESQGVGRVRCLSVDDPSGLFMVEGFVPTHNSNTIKVLCQQVFKYSTEKNKRVGQIIFDPQGEYANANVQDNGALSNLGTAKDVAIYRTTGVSNSGDREKPLLFNFFDEQNAELVWELMLSELHTGASSGSNYISGLRGLSLAPPAKTAPLPEKHRYGRRRLGLYSLMHLARMQGTIKNFYLTLDQDLTSKLHGIDPSVNKSKSNNSQLQITTPEGANAVFDWLLTQYEVGTLENDSWVKSFKDGEMATFKEQVEAYRSGRKGVTSAFMRLRELHSNTSSGDIREDVWKDLVDGKLVIVDLSRGSTAVTKAISEMIVTSLIKHASDRFVGGQDMIPFQIVVEEAHNLFSRGGGDDEYLDPWVRLSKEAAKYEIGLVYATQEVSSVDTKILSNTSNWVISHLSSKKETNELASYYSFAEWSEHLRRTETKGFVRLKTESSPFIVPVQISLFDPNRS